MKDSIISSKKRLLIKGAPGLPTLEGLVQVCNDPELDFVVLSSKFSFGLIDEDYDQVGNKNYYLYDCRYIREKHKDQ